MSKVIPSEEVADCKAWQVPDMQSGRRTASQPLTASQLEEVQNLAHREGFEQGQQEGREAGLKEFAEKARHLEQIFHALEQPFEQLDDEIEKQLVELAMVVARQLIRRELQADPGQVVGVVREALSALPLAAREVRLVLDPEDATIVREALALKESSSQIQIVEDPVIGRGGCRVLSEASQIDATVESRLNAVIANVLGGQRSSDGTER